MKIEYKSIGLVYGNLWGGGEGSYSTKSLTGSTREEIVEKAIKDLKDGSLDKGMGYESLIGAMLDITKITTTEIDGKPFVNEESEIAFVGKLNEKQMDFLEECYFQY